MQIEIVKLGKVKSNPNNPRVIKDDKFYKLVNSVLSLPKMMKIRPIVVDEQMQSLGGNMRLRVLQEIGKMSIADITARLASLENVKKKSEEKQNLLKAFWEGWLTNKTAPIIRADELDEDEQREFIVKDNVSGGDWDPDILSQEYELDELIDWGVDDWVLGIDDDEDQEDASAEDDDFDEDSDHIEVKCKKGDVWQLGEHRLMCGDSIQLAEVQRLMEGGGY